ncbi:homeobox protein vent1-like [Diretmus argenteus]
MGIDQALTRSLHMQIAAGARPYKEGSSSGTVPTHSSDPPWTYRSLTHSTASSMVVKHFSVDWLAQSHHSTTTPTEEHAAVSTTTQRPYIPCMVTPSPPTCYGKGYLQPKPRPSQPNGRMDPSETSSCSSHLHPASCSSPRNSGSEVSGYSSGYESEAASSECLSSVDEGHDAERDGAPRRVRTKFTPEQIHRLEKIFNKHKYLDAGERVKTAQKLHLTETQVRTWFQNRRMKLKREVQDYLAPSIPPVLFHPPVQYHSLGAQRLQYPPVSRAFYPVPVPVPQLIMQQQQQLPHQPPHLMIHNPHYF